MVTVPAVIPETTPVVIPTVAIEVLLLLHVPPVVASASVLVEPRHTLIVPVIGATEVEDVTVIVAYTPQPPTT